MSEVTTPEVVNAETATTAPAATKPEKAPKAPKDEQNGVVRPKAGTKTGDVWKFADELSAKTGEPAKRADVLKACEGAGINAATAATQFGRWCKYHGIVAKKEEAAPATEAAK